MKPRDSEEMQDGTGEQESGNTNTDTVTDTRSQEERYPATRAAQVLENAKRAFESEERNTHSASAASVGATEAQYVVTEAAAARYRDALFAFISTTG